MYRSYSSRVAAQGRFRIPRYASRGRWCVESMTDTSICAEFNTNVCIDGNSKTENGCCNDISRNPVESQPVPKRSKRQRAESTQGLVGITCVEKSQACHYHRDDKASQVDIVADVVESV